MLGTCDVMAFVATSDPSRSRSFYENALGLRLIADERWAIVFDANGTRLRIQKTQKFTPHPFTALGWEVEDIHGSIRDLTKKGVTFEKFNIPGFVQDELGIWTAEDGTKVAWFKDPDGNILSLTEFTPSH